MSSYLFCPANVSKYLINGLNSKAYAIIPDLEDSVPEKSKSGALQNIINIINNNNSNSKYIYPRIHNSSNYEWNNTQVDELSKLNIHGLMIPFTNDFNYFSKLIQYIKSINDTLEIIPLIESMYGIDNMQNLIKQNDLKFISFGKYDFSLDLNIDPEEQYYLINHIKQKFVLNALINNCYPIDTPELSLNNTELFKESCLTSKSIGFKAKLAVHPDQLEIINDVFNKVIYDEKDIIKIVIKYESLSKKGVGSFIFKNNIIDLPVYLNLKRVFKEKYE